MTAPHEQPLFTPAERASADTVQQQSREVQALAMLRQLLDAVPEILMVLNEERQAVFVNQHLLEFLGCRDPGSIYGARNGEILRCVHATETSGGCGTTESCRHCGAALAILASQRGEVTSSECRITREQDTEPLNLRVKASPLTLKGRQYTLFAMADISHEKRRQVLERVLFGELYQLSRELRDAGTSWQQAPADQIGAIAGTVTQIAGRLVEGINEHRLLLAAERGELRPKPVSLSSAEVLQQLAASYGESPLAEGRSIILARPVHSIVFTSDPALLKLALGHVIRNALEATSSGQTVTLNSGQTGDQVELSVHNPTSMPREVQLQVFQRGFSTKGEGRGLGTYTVKVITERCLKGKVSFASTANVGTTFRVSCPLVLAP